MEALRAQYRRRQLPGQQANYQSRSALTDPAATAGTNLNSTVEDVL